MSTRCQIIIKDEEDELWFYRHSDGYPSGTLPTLEKFMTWVKEGKIRDNVEQASGWLIIIGSRELRDLLKGLPDNYMDWKVGAYEPSVPYEHGDIEYLYELDLINLTIKITSKYKNRTSYARGWKKK